MYTLRLNYKKSFLLLCTFHSSNLHFLYKITNHACKKKYNYNFTKQTRAIRISLFFFILFI